MSRKTWAMSLTGLVFLGVLVWGVIGLEKRPLLPKTGPPAPLEVTIPTITPAVLGQQTKTAGCIDGVLPDGDCTPGAVFEGVTAEQICQAGYAKSVRNVPDSEKTAVYKEYGILTHKTGEYEVDHLVSLELGGSNEIANLWPEAAVPTPGFHEKDKVENYLHDQVCQGKISLNQAQTEISEDWVAVYQQMTLSPD
jgi:hypothetical protein